VALSVKFGKVGRKAAPIPALGYFLLSQIALDFLVSWIFPYDPSNEAIRMWPHLIHGALVLELVIYLMYYRRRIQNIKNARYQIMWLSVLFCRFLTYGEYNSEYAFYFSYYAHWIIVMWATYLLVVDGHLTARQVANTGMIMNALSILRLALYQFAGIFVGASGQLNPENQITNASYTVMWFTIMQLLDLNAPGSKIMTFLGMAAIVLTMKRGALVALLFGAIVYGIMYAYIHRHRHGVRRVLRIGAVMLLVVGLAFLSRSDEIMGRWAGLQDPADSGSGRQFFWIIILGHYVSADLPTKLLGFGPKATYTLLATTWFSESPAHNDWLQILHEFGIAGVLTFFAVAAAFVRTIPRIIRRCPRFAPAYSAALAGAFCMTLFDIFAYTTKTAWFSLIMAICLGMSAKQSAREKLALEGKKKAARRVGPIVPASLAPGLPAPIDS
jgi:hypothetical protein